MELPDVAIVQRGAARLIDRIGEADVPGVGYIRK